MLGICITCITPMVSEPDAPFPNVNDSAQMKRDFARARMLPKIFAMFGFTVIAVLVYFVF